MCAPLNSSLGLELMPNHFTLSWDTVSLVNTYGSFRPPLSMDIDINVHTYKRTYIKLLMLMMMIDVRLLDKNTSLFNSFGFKMVRMQRALNLHSTSYSLHLLRESSFSTHVKLTCLPKFIHRICTSITVILCLLTVHSFNSLIYRFHSFLLPKPLRLCTRL